MSLSTNADNDYFHYGRSHEIEDEEQDEKPLQNDLDGSILALQFDIDSLGKHDFGRWNRANYKVDEKSIVKYKVYCENPENDEEMLICGGNVRLCVFDEPSLWGELIGVNQLMPFIEKNRLKLVVLVSFSFHDF